MRHNTDRLRSWRFHKQIGCNSSGPVLASVSNPIDYRLGVRQQVVGYKP